MAESHFSCCSSCLISQFGSLYSDDIGEDQILPSADIYLFFDDIYLL